MLQELDDSHGSLDELLHLVLALPAEDWSMSPPPTELAAPSEVDRCSGNGLGHMLLSPPDPAWPALGKSSSPEPPSAGPEDAAGLSVLLTVLYI